MQRCLSLGLGVVWSILVASVQYVREYNYDHDVGTDKYNDDHHHHDLSWCDNDHNYHHHDHRRANLHAMFLSAVLWHRRRRDHVYILL